MDIAPFVEIRVTQRFRAPASRVFNAWIDPAIAGHWLFATASRPALRLTINARVGGAFRLVERGGGADIDYAGEYVEIAAPRRLVFALSGWKDSRDSARVTVAIAPLDAGCELTLVHEGVLPGRAARVEGRWCGMFYGLATILAPQRAAGA